MKFLSKKITASLLALSALGLSLNVVAATPKEIRISVSSAGEGGRPKIGGGFIATAHARGVLEQEFKKDGIKVTWLFFPGAGPATNEALANGKVDFATQGDLPSIVGRASGLKTKLLFGTARLGPVYFVVPSDSSAKRLADLKGKKIANFKGTNGQLVLARLFKSQNLNEKDFHVINQDTYSSRTAIATGDIDGTITTPWSLEARGVAKRLITSKDPKVSALSAFWVSEAFEKQYPEVVQRVVTTLVKQAHWSSQEANRNAQYKLWAQSGIPYIDYKKDWDGWDLKKRISPLIDDFHVAQYTDAVKLSKEARLIRRDVDVKTWYQPKYLNNALKELKLENYWQPLNANGKPK
ncbi:ABC transporter substrate-binding protein [Acinetobacter sp. YH16039]|uniref:ABC transporter substrate-binding protein n=1 Tax=Acinetobacter sp. YH16039 TaxID=2601184 RepID=UPI0015D2DF4A|nr:ABC transporter substrate-binding protein [Acinetobacter sp. YH16039]